VENGECFFVKKWFFPERRVHYVQYQYFLFYILLIWRGAYAPNAPPAYGPVGVGFGVKIKVIRFRWWLGFRISSEVIHPNGS